jgi:hypothetical protein
LAINFVKPDEETNEEDGQGDKTDKQVLLEIQEGFKIKIG